MKLNSEYKNITKNIIENDNFKALKNDIHHGSTRYDHCKRVSYLSYLIAKLFKGNVEEVAVSGLLHDFFHGKTNDNDEISYVNHPKKSVENAIKYFNINDNEINIIETHMYHYILLKSTFPFINKKEKVNSKEYKPTSKDGYIVCLSDLLISIYETLKFKVSYKTSLYTLFIINLIVR